MNARELEEGFDQEDPGAAQDESEEDLDTVDEDIFLDAVIVATDWTTETILSQVRRGRLELNPEFQRRDAWSRQRKSRFVESVMIGLPIPQIVLAEKQGAKGQYIVLDGKQRLLAMEQFAQEGGFKLTGLDIRRELNRKSYNDLSETDRIAFESQTIRTIVIRNWKREDFLYLVFLRLNTESVPLSPQELRQALRPGPFVSFVNHYTEEHDEFYRLFRRNSPDFRMRDVELLVRFFAFSYFLDRYAGNLKYLLDETCTRLNNEWHANSGEIQTRADSCRKAIAAIKEIFQDDAFRRWNGRAFERYFNRALFDVLVYFAADESVREKMRSESDLVIDIFKRACENPEFTESITTTTKSLGAVHSRLSIWANALNNGLGLQVAVPRLNEDKRIVFS